MLERCEGVPCPWCGCQDTRELERRERRGTRRADGRVEEVVSVERLLRCNHCGHPWREAGRWQAVTPAEPPAAEPAASVEYRPVRCPECGSVRCPVTHTARPVRSHKCRDCGATFKSVEK